MTNSRKWSTSLTCLVISKLNAVIFAGGFLATFSWPLHAQQSAAPTPPAVASALTVDDQQAGESEITDIEEYLLSPVTIADVLGDGGPPRPFIVSARAEYQFKTDIDNASDFSVSRLVGGGGVLFPLGQRTAGAVGAAFSHTDYDFDADAAFGGGEAWGDVQGQHGFLIVKHLLDRNWSVIGGAVCSFSGETGADTSSTFTGGGFIGGGYRASEDFYVQLGVNVSSQLEDDASVLPIFRLNWQIDEHWRFRAGVMETGATDTVGAGITYWINEQWSVHGRVGYVNRRFRLDDSGFAPEGVGQDRQYRAALSLTWEPNRNVQVGMIGGIAFGSDLIAENDDGDRIFKEDYDPVPFVSARLRWQF